MTKKHNKMYKTLTFYIKNKNSSEQNIWKWKLILNILVILK